MDLPMISPGWDVADAGLQQGVDVFWAQVLWWGTLSLVLVVSGLALLAVVSVMRVVPRRFWCPLAQRDVEVAFVECGIPGYQRAVAVQSCSVFDPPTDVRCERGCLDPGCRVGAPMAPLLQGRNP
jgi:hypothetical protein